MTGNTLDVKVTSAVDAGGRWDAVRVSHEVGVHLRRTLICDGRPTGPILVEKPRFLMYFFVPAGSLTAAELSGATLLGDGSTIVIPPYEPSERAPYGLEWLRTPMSVSPTAEQLADPVALVEATHLATRWGIGRRHGEDDVEAATGAVVTAL